MSTLARLLALALLLAPGASTAGRIPGSGFGGGEPEARLTAGVAWREAALTNAV